MKAKSGKKFRKIFKLYKLKLGFHPPYKIVLDGNFLHAATKAQFELKNRFALLFKGKIKLRSKTRKFITQPRPASSKSSRRSVSRSLPPTKRRRKRGSTPATTTTRSRPTSACATLSERKTSTG